MLITLPRSIFDVLCRFRTRLKMPFSLTTTCKTDNSYKEWWIEIEIFKTDNWQIKTTDNWRLSADDYWWLWTTMGNRLVLMTADNYWKHTDDYLWWQLMTDDWLLTTEDWQLMTDICQLTTNNWWLKTTNWKETKDKLAYSQVEKEDNNNTMAGVRDDE